MAGVYNIGAFRRLKAIHFPTAPVLVWWYTSVDASAGTCKRPGDGATFVGGPYFTFADGFAAWNANHPAVGAYVGFYQGPQDPDHWNDTDAVWVSIACAAPA